MQTHSIKQVLAERRQVANTGAGGGKKWGSKTKQQLILPTAADSAWLTIKQRARKREWTEGWEKSVVPVVSSQ